MLLIRLTAEYLRGLIYKDKTEYKALDMGFFCYCSTDT